MRPKKDRLSVFDLLVLVAATALGLAMTHRLPDYIALEIDVNVNQNLLSTSAGVFPSGWGWRTIGGPYLISQGIPFHNRPSYWLGHIPCWSGPCLLSLTIAAMVLVLRGSRPRLRQLARRPGMAAGLSVILALAVETMHCLRYLTTIGMMSSMNDEWLAYLVYALTSLTRLTGYTVAVWWLALALSGRWSAEVNAGGRLGQALGWCWIAMALSTELGMWCFALNY